MGVVPGSYILGRTESHLSIYVFHFQRGCDDGRTFMPSFRLTTYGMFLKQAHYTLSSSPITL